MRTTANQLEAKLAQRRGNVCGIVDRIGETAGVLVRAIADN
jgi:hypothetical protein